MSLCPLWTVIQMLEYAAVLNTEPVYLHVPCGSGVYRKHPSNGCLGSS